MTEFTERESVSSEQDTTLTCKYTTWNNLQVQQLELDSLWTCFPPVDKTNGEEFFSPLKDSIETEGMTNPIVIVPVSKEYTSRWSGIMAERLLTNPIEWDEDETQLAIFLGNNRYEVAQRLGYKSIDSVILEKDNVVSVARLTYP